MAFTAKNLNTNPSFNNKIKEANIVKEKELKFAIYRIITDNYGSNRELTVKITNEIVQHILDKGIKL